MAEEKKSAREKKALYLKDPKNWIKEVNAACRIAVIDDSPYARKTISKMVENSGLNFVGEGGNYQEAMMLVSQSKANLLIIDVVMPDMTGIEMLDHLRENHQNLYAVMVSSMDHEQVLLESIAAGALDFITKPIDEDILHKTLFRLAQQIAEDSQ